MARDRHYRFESGPLVWFSAGLVVAAVIGLMVAVIFTGGNALAVGMLILVIAAVGTGLILKRLDPSRRSGSKGEPEEFWGFRGRPGS